MKLLFSRLRDPDNLVNSAISQFVAAKASHQPVSSAVVSDRSDPIRVVLPFKDQVSADIVRAQLKAGVHMKAVFWLGIMAVMQISRLRFKQSKISMLIPHIYFLGRFVNFLVIFCCIWR